MDLNKRLERVAILGAGGKMGSGISLLLALEMALQMRHPENTDRSYRLTLMDVSEDALEGLKQYLKKQAAKYAQKRTDVVAANYPELSGPEAVADAFVNDVMSILHPVADLAQVDEAHLVFEAILENIDLKVKVFSQLNAQLGEQAFYLSNTSSIPIHELEDKVGLTGRLIGFHFYNPPAVQKLVELIVPESAMNDLVDISHQLGERLKKKIIVSNDIAGFIGNGHFMRDGLHGISEVERLQPEMSFSEAVYTMNRISQDFLIRPMGIFQLIDYVGLDVFQSILKIMNPHFPSENLHSELIDRLVTQEVKGGQYSDGSQKDGFFKYSEGKMSAVYNIETGEYEPLDDVTWISEVDARIGELPASYAPWKAMLKDAERSEKLDTYFTDLVKSESFGATLARAYLGRSKAIGELLIEGGVADSKSEVNGVLMNGFFHLYGPVNDYI